MEASNIYRKAIELLFHKTYGKMEHGEKKAIELFDQLLGRDIESHCDVVKQFCREAGYDEHASKEIAQI